MRKITRKIRNHFIPHQENDYKPHFLRHESMLFVLLVIIVLEAGFLAQVFLVFDKTKFLASVLPGVLTTLTNSERAQNNASPLVENDLLKRAAQMKADDMATRGYFSHNTPEGRTPWYWLDLVGYKYSYAGENLAVNFFESEDVARAWMASPSHRANMVKQKYEEIGIAVANGVYKGQHTVFVTQFFGTPAKKVISPKAPVPVAPPVETKVALNNKEVTNTTITPIETKVLGEETTASEILAEEETAKPIATSSLWQRILTSPNKSLSYAFGAIILIVLVTLIIFLVKSEIKHPAIMARGLFLIAVIIFLLFVNLNFFYKKTVTPTEENSSENFTTNPLAS